jgi:O-acetylhomoserine (thiol)-lyase
VAVPIYQTTSYAFDSTQHGADLFDLKVAGNIYTRIMNPTQDVLEKRVAALEGGIAGLALASGQAAITYAIQTICRGRRQHRLGQHALRRHLQPVRPHPAAVRHRSALRRLPRPADAFEKLIDGKTKAIYCESVGNPLGNITDFEKLAEIAHRHGIPLIVDNTVPSPYLCRPIEHGADIVVHSLTKYSAATATPSAASSSTRASSPGPSTRPSSSA